jgi:hypothetical protein
MQVVLRWYMKDERLPLAAGSLQLKKESAPRCFFYGRAE